ncbi:MAG: hypothetical protein EOP33_05240 [Rickettsiaceae bacterium]|nr:MAG: hypothetical protein EOP33_05240 [Rickettsiaceae bacterium]
MIFNRAKTTRDRRFNSKVTQKCQVSKFSLTKKSGNLDQGLSDLVDLIIYWYKPQPAIDPNSGARQFIHKFQGNVWQTSYNYLTKKFDCSKETIRRRIVKLEQLGYIKREFKDILVNGQGYNNRLFIHLSNNFFKTVTGFNKISYNGEDKMFINSEAFAPLKNHQLIAENKLANNKVPSPQKKEVLNIDIYNTIFKNRSSEANLQKNKVKVKAATIKMQEEVNKEQVEQENKAKQEHAADNSDYDDNNDSTSNKALDKQIEPSKVSRKPLTTKSWLGNSVKTFALKAVKKIRSYKRKALSEFYPLSEEEAEVLCNTSGREFNVHFINQLLLKLAKNKPNHGFFTKDLFMNYMAKVLTYELHQAAVTNNESFKFKEQDNQETKQTKHQEQYLESVEYSTDTSHKGQLRRKIAAVFEADTAYKILSGYKFDNSDENINKDRGNGESGNKTKAGHSSSEFKFTAINNYNTVELSTSEQARLLAQVQTVYGNNIERIVIKASDPITKADIKQNREHCTAKPEVLGQDPNSIWDKVSSALLKQYGEAIHTSWFSKLSAEEDKENKQLMLKAPTNFISSWINEKYGYLINQLIHQHNYSCVIK